MLAARAAGTPVSEIAARFQVSGRTITRWQQRQQDSGIGLAPSPIPGRPPRMTVADAPALIALVTADPDATLQEYCDRWTAQQDGSVSRATMCRQLQRLGLTRKKDPGRPRTGSGRARLLAGGPGGAGPAATRLRR